MRYLNLLPMTALIVATPFSAPLPAQPADATPARQRMSAENPDAVCEPFLRQFREQGADDSAGYGRRGGIAYSTGNPAPPAPPPQPMPPPPQPMPVSPPPVAQENADVAVTGARIRLPNLTMEQPAPMARAQNVENRERYSGEPVATVQSVAERPVSTFSVDVDTGAYSNVRRMLSQGQMPPQGAVRTEEMLNYFRYDYPAPRDRSQPFSVNADMTTTPWNPETRLLRVGLRGYDIDRTERPPANLVFLVDVSGSMSEIDKHPLVQCSLALVAGRMGPRDRVSIVAYAG